MCVQIAHNRICLYESITLSWIYRVKWSILKSILSVDISFLLYLLSQQSLLLYVG